MHCLWPQIESCQSHLWRAVCGYETEAAAREDLLQEVLLALWEALPKLRDPQRLLPFALRVAHNLGASHVRRAVRDRRRVPIDECDLDHNAATSAPDDRSQWLYSALNRLPVTLRQPLMLQLEGFEYKEIAEMLGISVDNVGVRVHRARAQLKSWSGQE